jgi:NitT/TauT family transport system substrate-binding protein
MHQTTLPFLSALSFLFVLSPPTLHAFDKVRVGLSSVTGIMGSIWVAEEKKIFQKYGIEPEVIIIGGGGARGVSALMAGDIQFSTGAGDAFVRASLKGADVVMVASIVTKGLQRVMTRPELKTPADLKSKTIAITRFGSASHWVLRLMLERWGIRPDELQVIQVGSSPSMLVNLDKGAVDAAILSMPSFFVAADRGYRLLADLGEMDIYSLQNALSATRQFLQTQGDIATRFIKGYMEGVAYYKKYKQETLQVLRKKLRIDADQKADLRYLESSYELLAKKYYEPLPYPSVKGVESILKFLREEDPKIKKTDARSFINDSIVREIVASGFVDALYRK